MEIRAFDGEQSIEMADGAGGKFDLQFYNLEHCILGTCLTSAVVKYTRRNDKPRVLFTPY